MKQQIKLLKPHINVYHLDSSLLLQFILSEFLTICCEIQAIKSLPSKLSEADREKLEYTLSHLSGASKEYMRLFSWNSDGGILAKLKSYCGFFAQNSDLSEKKLRALHHKSNQIWLQCLQCLDLVRSDEGTELILKSIDKLVRGVQQIGKLIADILPEFRDDENVLFFLLRNYKELDAAYSPRFISKTLKKMFNGGAHEAGRLMIVNYTQRGFNNLVPIIQDKILEVAS